MQLYHHYLDLLLKFNVFYYAVTGAILSFVVTRRELLQARWALLLPVLMALMYAVLFLVGTCGAERLLTDLEADTKHFSLRSVPDVRLLTWFLGISAALLLLVAAGLLILVGWPEIIGSARSG